MKFYFCETCGKRVTEKDIDGGSAKNKKLKGIYCTACSEGVMTMETLPMNNEEATKLLRSQSAATRSATRTSRSRMRPTSSRTPGDGSSRALPAVGAPEPMSERKKLYLALGGGGCGGLLVLGVILFLMSGSSNSQQAQKKSPSRSQKKKKRKSVRPVPQSLPRVVENNSTAAPLPDVASNEKKDPEVQTQVVHEKKEFDFLAQRIKSKWSEALKKTQHLKEGSNPIEVLKGYRAVHDTLRSFPGSRITAEMREKRASSKKAAEAALTALLKNDESSEAGLAGRIKELEAALQRAGGLASRKQVEDRLTALKKEQLAELLKGKKLLPGLVADLHRGDVMTLARARTFKPHRRQIVTKMENPRGKGRPYYNSGTSNKLSGRFTGFFMAKTTGKYSFHLLIEDGGILEIDGKKVLGEWDDRRTHRLSGSIHLTAGPHPMTLLHHQGGGNWALTLHVKGPDGVKRLCNGQDMLHTPSELDLK